jgi:hypothetical protein
LSYREPDCRGAVFGAGIYLPGKITDWREVRFSRAGKIYLYIFFYAGIFEKPYPCRNRHEREFTPGP